jgi:hypothetical protein
VLLSNREWRDAQRALDPNGRDDSTREVNRRAHEGAPLWHLSEAAKRAMWLQHQSDPSKYPPRILANLWRISLARTEAILKMEEVRHRQLKIIAEADGVPIEKLDFNRLSEDISATAGAVAVWDPPMVKQAYHSRGWRYVRDIDGMY